MSKGPRRQRISPWVNPVTRALRQGKVCLGAHSLAFPYPAVAQIFAQAGFDFLVFDMEHTSMPIDAVEPICTAAKLTGIVPIVGTTGAEDFLVSRPLDSGAMGVIAPHIETRRETELVVSACRYSPEGTRGLLPIGALTEFEQVDEAKWVEAANREVLVAVKVESKSGIENIEEIAAVPGLNAIIVGPQDLAASYGVPGQPNHPHVRQAIDRMLAACKSHGVAGGSHTGTAEGVRDLADRGATFLTCAVDTRLLLDASKRVAESARDLLEERMPGGDDR